jgi:sec-independent protein translocase protein TatA
MNTLAFSVGMPEMLVLALLGLLIFGRRLPEVGRSLGKGIVEFKKGLAGIEDDMDKATHAPSNKQIDSPPASTTTSTSDQQNRTPQV